MVKGLFSHPVRDRQVQTGDMVYNIDRVHRLQIVKA